MLPSLFFGFLIIVRVCSKSSCIPVNECSLRQIGFDFDMDTFDFDESLKNIPIPNREHYIKIFIAKINEFIERLRWKVWFKLNPKTKQEYFDNYGFKTARSAPQIKDLAPFENDVFSLVQNIEFDARARNTPFQKKLSAKVKEINKSEDVFPTS